MDHSVGKKGIWQYKYSQFWQANSECNGQSHFICGSNNTLKYPTAWQQLIKSQSIISYNCQFKISFLWTFLIIMILLTSILWSNWTVVGFSKTFLMLGENASRSSGIQRSPIFGKELYTRPASRPATKAPVEIDPQQQSLRCSWMINFMSLKELSACLVNPIPDKAVRKTNPPVPLANRRSCVRRLVSRSYKALKEKQSTKVNFSKRDTK